MSLNASSLNIRFNSFVTEKPYKAQNLTNNISNNSNVEMNETNRQTRTGKVLKFLKMTLMLF